MNCISSPIASDVSVFTLPTLHCPIPAKCNPFAEFAQAQSLEWAIKFNLVQPQTKAYQHLQFARFGWLAAQTYPHASGEDLVLITIWATWFFLHDDLCDESEIGLQPEQLAKLDAHFISILNGSAVPDPDRPLALALANLAQQLYLRSGKDWYQCFVKSVQQCFNANLWEAIGRLSLEIPDRCYYLKMRLFTGAVYTGFNLINLAWDIDPQAKFLQDDRVKQLTQMAGNLICWQNDILSLPKEVKEGNPYNLVLILQREDSLSLTEAKCQTIQMCNHEMQMYLYLFAQIPFFGEEQLEARQYLNGLSDWIRGHLDWCLNTHRYLA